MLKFNDINQVKKYIDERDIKFISFYVIDIEGRLRNVTIPSSYFSEKTIENGIGFDASNLGYAEIEKSDMIFKPDLNFAFEDPVLEVSNILYFFCNVFSVHTGKSFSQDLRHIIKSSLDVLKSEGIADEVNILVEFEFNIIDELYSILNEREISYRIESSEKANPPDGRDIYRLAPNHGYFRSQPNDHTFYIRNEIVNALENLDLRVKYHHHEVGTSQAEIEFQFMPVELAADATVLAKNLSHRIAKKHNKIISFLPKIVPGEAGNGMHCHMYLVKNKKNIFNDNNGIYSLSKTALYFIGGILKHIQSLSAFTNPTTNSYRRIITGGEAPSKAVFAEANRSAAIRIPGYVKNSDMRRFEFRAGDATCNPYLAFSALIMAGIDGVRRKIDPQKEGFGPLETNIYNLPQDELSKIPSLPDSLKKSLENLKEKNDYLLYKNVFPLKLLHKWIYFKQKDIEEMQQVPHPWEIARYYDL